MRRLLDPAHIERASHIKAGAFYAGLLITVMVWLAACSQTDSTVADSCPTPPPIYTGPNPVETYIAQADVIVVGIVGKGEPEILVGRSFYRDWELEVEQYVTEPLPHDTLVVRTLTGATNSVGYRMPVKSPSLAQGQRVLLFLEKDWDDPPLAVDEFTIVDLFGGTFWIRDGRVSIRYLDESEEYTTKELEEVIRRITDIVKSC